MKRNAILNEGQTYRNRNGSDYICKQILLSSDGTIMERTTDRWTLTAHGITLYDDGTIEWDYSTSGHWLHGEPEGTAKQTPFTPEQEKRITEIVRATLSEGRETGSPLPGPLDPAKRRKWRRENLLGLHPTPDQSEELRRAIQECHCNP